MNNRRKLVIAFGAGALAAPFASFAQPQGRVWRVGYLASQRRPVSLDVDTQSGAFRQGMRELGYVEGKNLVIEWRFAEGRTELLPVLAAELVQMNVDVILSEGTTSTRAAQQATTIIPIVIGNAGDPVGSGFVKSLARPGGNITGLSNIAPDISSKHLEMLRSFVPKLTRVAVLVIPDNASHAAILKSVQTAGQRVGINIVEVQARAPQEIPAAFSKIIQERAGALIVARDPLFYEQRSQIADLASKYRLPSIAARWEFARVGGLMSYGTSSVDSYRRAATYVDKIFKGAKPADLPVEQPMRFELFINGKTAKALGLKIPQSLLIMADKVLE
jgi:putative ABC transport system substrate-binding protein